MFIIIISMFWVYFMFVLHFSTKTSQKLHVLERFYNHGYLYHKDI